MDKRDKERLEAMRDDFKGRMERSPERQHLDANTMEEIIQETIGQSYLKSIFDDRGCYMGRNGSRLEPKGVVEAVRLALDAMDILLEPPHDEPEEDEKNGE